MLYLAILLILCGLLILITALFVESGKGSAATWSKSSDLKKTGDSDSKCFESGEMDVIYPDDRVDIINDNIDEEDIFISFDDEPEDLSELRAIPEKVKYDIDNSELLYNERSKPEGYIYKATQTVFSTDTECDAGSDKTETDQGVISAVMFDDRSNIIDYEAGVGAIDSTLSKYKSIKRIGRGKIESDYDGVNFYLDEKLYRFDFHKVYDIWSGSDYIALPLKGNSTVKLFLIENSPGFPEKVETDFKEYEKGL